MNPALIQLIGFAAVGFAVLSFQLKKRSAILAALIATQVIFSIHFSLLGAYTAASINVIAAMRGYIFYLKPTQAWANSPLWLYGFIAAFWLSGFFTWEGYRSLLPMIGMTIESIALWLDKPKQVRRLMLCTRPIWFIYNLLVGSVAAISADVLITTSLITGMVRLDRTKTTKTTPL